MELNSRKVLLLGATGLVGRQCLRLLLKDEGVSTIRVLARRPLAEADHPKVEFHLTDFADLAAHPEWFAVDQVLCALGTTIAEAGSQELFRAVDQRLPVEIAKLAKARGASHFLLVSAIGANERSFFFYNRVKGEVEEDLKILDYPSLTFARPSLLLGTRERSRPMEKLGAAFGFLMPAASSPVHAWQVALALVQAAAAPKPGVQVISNAEMRKLKEV